MSLLYLPVTVPELNSIVVEVRPQEDGYVADDEDEGEDEVRYQKKFEFFQ